MKLESAFSRVVLPEPVPPLTTTLRRSDTAVANDSSWPSVRVPDSTSCRGPGRRTPKRRIERTGPSTASGGITTLTREPSASLASTIGLSSSTRRPSGARIRSIAFRSCSSSANRVSAGSIRPRRSTKTVSAPLTITSSTAGSESRSSSGPRPTVSRRIPATTASRSASPSRAASRSTRARTSTSRPSEGPAPRAASALRRSISRERSAAASCSRWRSRDLNLRPPVAASLVGQSSRRRSDAGPEVWSDRESRWPIRPVRSLRGWG